MAGKEPENTNAFLQALARAATSNSVDSARAVASTLALLHRDAATPRTPRAADAEMGPVARGDALKRSGALGRASPINKHRVAPEPADAEEGPDLV